MGEVPSLLPETAVPSIISEPVILLAVEPVEAEPDINPTEPHLV
jgi:hypothetical protein